MKAIIFDGNEIYAPMTARIQNLAGVTNSRNSGLIPPGDLTIYDHNFQMRSFGWQRRRNVSPNLSPTRAGACMKAPNMGEFNMHPLHRPVTVTVESNRAGGGQKVDAFITRTSEPRKCNYSAPVECRAETDQCTGAVLISSRKKRLRRVQNRQRKRVVGLL